MLNYYYAYGNIFNTINKNKKNKGNNSNNEDDEIFCSIISNYFNN